jgi:hypothetical protein
MLDYSLQKQLQVLEMETEKLKSDIESRKTLLSRLENEFSAVDKEKSIALTTNNDLKQQVPL